MIEIQRYLIALSLLRYRKIIDKTREINKYYGTSTFGIQAATLRVLNVRASLLRTILF